MSYFNQLSNYLEKSKDESSRTKTEKSENANNNKNALLQSNNDILPLSNLNSNNYLPNHENLKSKPNSLKESTATTTYLCDSLIYNKKNYEKIVQDCLNFENVELKAVK